MKKHIKLFIFLSILYIHTSYGQNGNTNLPEIIPLSPQATQFARYGEIPVGHTTGVPQIEVPIYTLSTGWIDIPVSLSYHASGFRVRDIPSPVGLGWVLNAGGVISRSIEMLPDMTYPYDFMKVKSVEQVDSLKNGTKTLKLNQMYADINLSDYNHWMYWDRLFFNQDVAQFDTRSDRYIYSYPGNSGIARYNAHTKELTPVPYSPIKMRCFYDYKASMITHYTITDTKGIQYKFAHSEGISVLGQKSYTTSWYLTEITYPGREDDPIEFIYSEGEIYHDFGYTTNIQFFFGLFTASPGAISSPLSSINGTTSINKTSHRSPLLKTIKWRSNSITFNYIFDRKDRRKERLNSIVVKNGENIVKQAILDNNRYFGNEPENYRMKMEGVTLQGNCIGENKETYKFHYNYKENETEFPNYYYIEAPGYQKKDKVRCSEDYWGYYNGKKSEHCYPWDIAKLMAKSRPSGTSENAVLLYTSNRDPSEYHTKTCILEEIVYPTKGKTRFEYEINRASSNAYGYTNSNNNALGGLRIKKRINYSANDEVLDTKEYEYLGEPTMRIDASLFAYGKKVVAYEVIQTSLGPTERPVHLSLTNCISVPISSLTAWSSSPVFYNCVKEYNGTKNQSHSGWTEYRYRVGEDSGILGCYHEGDYIPFYFSNYADCDRGELKGLPTFTITYDKEGQPVKKIETKYKDYIMPKLPTGVRISNRYEYRPLFIDGLYLCTGGFQCLLDKSASRTTEYQAFLNEIISFNTYALQDISLPESTIETEYIKGQPIMEKTTSYDYAVENGKPIILTPNSISTTNSIGETISKKTYFSFRDSDMKKLNILDLPTEETTYKDDELLNTKYMFRNGISFGKRAFLINEIAIKQRDMVVPYETQISYRNYDQYANPVYIRIKGVDNIVYLWSYNGQHPIAEIKNATFDEVETVVKTLFSVANIEALSAMAAPNEAKLKDGSLQKALPNAHVSTYSYKPLVGMTSATDPSGKTTYYDYDSSNRLTRVYIKELDENNKEVVRLLHSYNYHYINK